MILYVRFRLSIWVLFLSISLSLFLYFSVSLCLCFSASLFISSSFSILLSFSLLLFSLYHSNSLSLSDFRLCWNTERSLICFIFVVIILLFLSLSLIIRQWTDRSISRHSSTSKLQRLNDEKVCQETKQTKAEQNKYSTLSNEIKTERRQKDRQANK
jgi:type III secretory pathway component EscU